MPPHKHLLVALKFVLPRLIVFLAASTPLTRIVKSFALCLCQECVKPVYTTGRRESLTDLVNVALVSLSGVVFFPVSIRVPDQNLFH
jgi:hypothetical protein